MTPDEHAAAAEQLLDRGVEVVGRLRALADRRKFAFDYPGQHREMTAKMDELGKKAMGIWAQAQVHATLSTRGA